MGKKQNIAISKFDALIADHTEDGLLSLVSTRLSDGEMPHNVAKSLGVPYIALRRWLEMEDSRVAEVALAMRCRAEVLAHESLDVVDELVTGDFGSIDVDGERVPVKAGKEDIAIAKLRSDHRLKLASSWDKRAYGTEKELGAGAVQVVVNRDGVLMKVGQQTMKIEGVGPVSEDEKPMEVDSTESTAKTIDGETIDGEAE